MSLSPLYKQIAMASNLVGPYLADVLVAWVETTFPEGSLDWEAVVKNYTISGVKRPTETQVAEEIEKKVKNGQATAAEDILSLYGPKGSAGAADSEQLATLKAMIKDIRALKDSPLTPDQKQENAQKILIELNAWMECPITFEVIHVPAKCSKGTGIYENSKIRESLSQDMCNPMDGVAVDSDAVTLKGLAKALQEFRERLTALLNIPSTVKPIIMESIPMSKTFPEANKLAEVLATWVEENFPEGCFEWDAVVQSYKIEGIDAPSEAQVAADIERKVRDGEATAVEEILSLYGPKGSSGASESVQLDNLKLILEKMRGLKDLSPMRRQEKVLVVLEDLNAWMCCPIAGSSIQFPAKCSSGAGIFEKSKINKWLLQKMSNPTSNERVEESSISLPKLGAVLFKLRDRFLEWGIHSPIFKEGIEVFLGETYPALNAYSKSYPNISKQEIQHALFVCGYDDMEMAEPPPSLGNFRTKIQILNEWGYQEWNVDTGLDVQWSSLSGEQKISFCLSVEKGVFTQEQVNEFQAIWPYYSDFLSKIIIFDPATSPLTYEQAIAAKPALNTLQQAIQVTGNISQEEYAILALYFSAYPEKLCETLEQIIRNNSILSDEIKSFLWTQIETLYSNELPVPDELWRLLSNPEFMRQSETAWIQRLLDRLFFDASVTDISAHVTRWRHIFIAIYKAGKLAEMFPAINSSIFERQRQRVSEHYDYRYGEYVPHYQDVEDIEGQKRTLLFLYSEKRGKIPYDLAVQIIEDVQRSSTVEIIDIPLENPPPWVIVHNALVQYFKVKSEGQEIDPDCWDALRRNPKDVLLMLSKKCQDEGVVMDLLPLVELVPKGDLLEIVVAMRSEFGNFNKALVNRAITMWSTSDWIANLQKSEFLVKIDPDSLSQVIQQHFYERSFQEVLNNVEAWQNILKSIFTCNFGKALFPAATVEMIKQLNVYPTRFRNDDLKRTLFRFYMMNKTEVSCRGEWFQLRDFVRSTIKIVDIPETDEGQYRLHNAVSEYLICKKDSKAVNDELLAHLKSANLMELMRHICLKSGSLTPMDLPEIVELMQQKAKDAVEQCVELVQNLKKLELNNLSPGLLKAMGRCLFFEIEPLKFVPYMENAWRDALCSRGDVRPVDLLFGEDSPLLSGQRSYNEIPIELQSRYLKERTEIPYSPHWQMMACVMPRRDLTITNITEPSSNGGVVTALIHNRLNRYLENPSEETFGPLKEFCVWSLMEKIKVKGMMDLVYYDHFQTWILSMSEEDLVQTGVSTWVKTKMNVRDFPTSFLSSVVRHVFYTTSLDHVASELYHWESVFRALYQARLLGEVFVQPSEKLEYSDRLHSYILKQRLESETTLTSTQYQTHYRLVMSRMDFKIKSPDSGHEAARLHNVLCKFFSDAYVAAELPLPHLLNQVPLAELLLQFYSKMKANPTYQTSATAKTIESLISARVKSESLSDDAYRTLLTRFKAIPFCSALKTSILSVFQSLFADPRALKFDMSFWEDLFMKLQAEGLLTETFPTIQTSWFNPLRDGDYDAEYESRYQAEDARQSDRRQEIYKCFALNRSEIDRDSLDKDFLEIVLTMPACRITQRAISYTSRFSNYDLDIKVALHNDLVQVLALIKAGDNIPDALKQRFRVYDPQWFYAQLSMKIETLNEGLQIDTVLGRMGLSPTIFNEPQEQYVERMQQEFFRLFEAYCRTKNKADLEQIEHFLMQCHKKNETNRRWYFERVKSKEERLMEAINARLQERPYRTLVRRISDNDLRSTSSTLFSKQFEERIHLLCMLATGIANPRQIGEYPDFCKHRGICAYSALSVHAADIKTFNQEHWQKMFLHQMEVHFTHKRRRPDIGIPYFLRTANVSERVDLAEILIRHKSLLSFLSSCSIEDQEHFFKNLPQDCLEHKRVRKAKQNFERKKEEQRRQAQVQATNQERPGAPRHSFGRSRKIHPLPPSAANASDPQLPPMGGQGPRRIIAVKPA